MEDKKQSKIKGLFSIIKGFFKCVAWAVLIILIVIAVFLVYYVLLSKKASNEGVQYKPPMALYTIISPSMQPNINVYDVVFSVKTTGENVKKGDVITFYSPNQNLKGKIITHRVINVKKTNTGYQFRTKGDNNIEADSGLVPEDNIIGKVQLKIPKLGKAQFFLKSKKGWIIAILIPALIVISYDILKLFRMLKLKKQIRKNKKEEKSIINNENNINSNNNIEPIKQFDNNTQPTNTTPNLSQNNNLSEQTPSVEEVKPNFEQGSIPTPTNSQQYEETLTNIHSDETNNNDESNI